MVDTCIEVRCFLVLKYCRLLLQLVVSELRAALVTQVDLVIPAACVVVSVAQVDLVIPTTCAAIGVVRVFLALVSRPSAPLQLMVCRLRVTLKLNATCMRMERMRRKKMASLQYVIMGMPCRI